MRMPQWNFECRNVNAEVKTKRKADLMRSIGHAYTATTHSFYNDTGSMHAKGLGLTLMLILHLYRTCSIIVPAPELHRIFVDAGLSISDCDNWYSIRILISSKLTDMQAFYSFSLPIRDCL